MSSDPFDTMAVTYRVNLNGSGVITQDIDGRVMTLPQGFNLSHGFVTSDVGVTPTVNISVGTLATPDGFIAADLTSTPFAGEPFEGLLVNTTLGLSGDLPIIVTRAAAISTDVILTLHFEGVRIL